jgi:hypothetical protein
MPAVGDSEWITERQPFTKEYDMESVQSRGLQCFRRVEAWFADHPTVVPAAGSSAGALGAQVTALQQVVDRMTAQATEETTQASQATLAAKDEPALRKELRMLHMRAIVTVAGALRGKVPGIGVFKTPSRDMGSESLVSAAEAMHEMAAPYESVFVEHGLPADFLAQLDAAALALKLSVDARGVAQSRRTGAGTSLGNDLKLGKQILSMISASLSYALKSDPATLASWRQARRVTVKGVQSKAVPVSAPPASGSVSAASNGVSAAAAALEASPVGASANSSSVGPVPGGVGAVPSSESRAA